MLRNRQTTLLASVRRRQLIHPPDGWRRLSSPFGLSKEKISVPDGCAPNGTGLVLLAFGELRSLGLLSPCFAGGAKKNGSQQGALLTGRGSSCSSATTRGGPSRPLFDFLTIHRMLKIASQPSNNPPRFGQASPTDSSTGWTRKNEKPQTRRGPAVFSGARLARLWRASVTGTYGFPPFPGRGSSCSSATGLLASVRRRQLIHPPDGWRRLSSPFGLSKEKISVPDGNRYFLVHLQGLEPWTP